VYSMDSALSFLWMFYAIYFGFIAHSTNLTLFTDYEVCGVLTVDDGDNEVRWWWLVEEWEGM